jgi:hypothetical protein
VLDEQPRRLALGDLLAAAHLPDVDDLGVGSRAREGLVRDQAVVEDDVGARDELERARGEQAGSPGPAPTR